MQTSHPRISLIAAIGAHTRALGKDNDLLWHIPDDLKRFRQLTSGHAVIMGRKTWESIPEKYRPLPNRLNIVVTRQSHYHADGATVCNSLEEAFDTARTNSQDDETFVIGGGQLYEEALPFAHKLYLTLIDDDKEGDVFFPEYKNKFTKVTFEEKKEFDGLFYTWINLESA